MRRLRSAISEWLQLRSRLRDERGFHLDSAEAEFRGDGLSHYEAKQAARRRLGSRRSRTIAARELGSDLAGLAELMRVHRVWASPWLQPAILVAAIALIFVFGPGPSEIVNGIVVRLHRVEQPGAVQLFGPQRITTLEFGALRSMTTLAHVERYGGRDVWGRAVPGAALSAIQAEARRKTGNPQLAAQFVKPKWELVANPAQIVWMLVAVYGIFPTCRYLRHFGGPRRMRWKWLAYGGGVAALHAVASMAAWALVYRNWNAHFTLISGGLFFAALFAAYSAVVAFQCRHWWIDLRERCPVCFERLVLPLTEGAEDSVIFSPAVTESVCVHGHGVLVESRWSLEFRPEESPLESLVDL